MIKQVEVKAFEERLFCDKCGEEMLWNGMSLTSWPEKYPYECPSCGHCVTVEEKFPRIIHKSVKDMP